MVCSSVVPFLLLALATLSLARRYQWCRGGPAGPALLLASPRALTFGGKVMVETFLAFWVLLALAWPASWPAVRVGERESRWGWRQGWPC